MRKWKIPILGGLLAAVVTQSVAAAGVVPYGNYTYLELDGSVIQGPQAYVPEQVVYGIGLGIGALVQPADLHDDENGDLYLLDGGSGCVVVLNSELQLLRQFQGFDNGGQADAFDGAKGLFVDDTWVYIADTLHERVVILDKRTGALKHIVRAPQAAILGEGFLFKPIRLVADADRLLYIVGEGTYEGIINVDWDGNFIGFVGSNRVVASAWDIFWQRYSTREQRKTMTQFVPQDHSSIDIDGEGFFFATSYTSKSTRLVKRLNPGGDDVIRSLSRTPLKGDPQYYWEGSLKGASSFVDVASGPDGMYLCLDSTRGRLFCYNNDGYLLYTFGGMSAQAGGFSRPVAVTWMTDGRVAVADSARGTVTVFRPTDYALAIQKGIAALNEFRYADANRQWETVLSMNSQFEMGRREIGKVYVSEKKYRAAMREFREASDKKLYSRALQLYRSDWIYHHAGAVLITAAVILAGCAVSAWLFRRRRRLRGNR